MSRFDDNVGLGRRVRGEQSPSSTRAVLSQEKFMTDYLLCVFIENPLCILYIVKIAQSSTSDCLSRFDDDVGSGGRVRAEQSPSPTRTILSPRLFSYVTVISRCLCNGFKEEQPLFFGCELGGVGGGMWVRSRVKDRERENEKDRDKL